MRLSSLTEQSKCNSLMYWATRVGIIVMILMLTACQSLSFINNNKVDFSHYYLWIKSLNNEEITQEIMRQKRNKQSGFAKADVQLIMLYSLPNSPIHNPYTAKSQLNAYQLEPFDGSIFNADDLAFIVMLKDQLNEQLLLLEQLDNYKGAYKQAKQLLADQQLQIANNQQKIQQLNKQIMELKKIEKTISQRGQ